MNPEQEYTLRAGAIGMLHGFANALETLQAPQLQRAVAFQRTVADVRAIEELRQIATEYGLSAGVAEQRYWGYVEAGCSEYGAFNEVRAELDQA